MGLYEYAPSFGAAIVFAALFGIASIVHFLQLIHTRTWFFIPFLIGGICTSSLLSPFSPTQPTYTLSSVETVGFAAVCSPPFSFPQIISNNYTLPQRAVSAHQAPNYTQPPSIIQAILILVAPALFAASIYMSLGRIIILTHGEKYALIRRSWLTKIFVLGDVVSFLAQAGGMCPL